LEEKERKRKQLEEFEQQKQLEQENEKQQAIEEQKRVELEKLKKYEEQKRIIQEILNRQTINQFSSYAKQQYPNNLESQEQLITQLQEQHFQQYMQQMMEQSNELLDGSGLPFTNAIQNLNDKGEGVKVIDSPMETAQEKSNGKQESSTLDESFEDESDSDDEEEETVESIGKDISNASMWTRKDIAIFKDSIRSEGGDGILKVGHGEIATIRVPTHENGNCIFWEFATDSYDIGFGLLFEWNPTPDNQVSIHISESEDEDDDEGELEPIARDVEQGSATPSNLALKPSKAGELQSPISVIIPIYRRDSHEEVFAGSHSYPGKGVYLLKFDNSYSLWRSKTLYYRVYYTKETWDYIDLYIFIQTVVCKFYVNLYLFIIYKLIY